METLEQKIEAVLFYKAEPVSKNDLAKLLNAEPQNIGASLETLQKSLAGRGLRLVFKEDEVELRTAPEMSPLIESIRKNELSKDLGKAGLETLAIVLYRGPIARRDIDYIRGVNSNFILRMLMIRGLIERASDPNDARSFLYKPTIELLSHLGVSDITTLPEFEAVKKEISEFSDHAIQQNSTE